MLHIAKIFCLILVATATSIFAEEPVMSAVDKFNAAVRLSRQNVNSEENLIMQDLMKLKKTALLELDKLGEQVGPLRRQELLVVRTMCEELVEEIRQQLSDAKADAVRRFANSKEEVKTHLSMYAEHRISEAQAAMFINENEQQLKAIVDSTMSAYATVDQKVKEMNRSWNDDELLDVRR